MPASERLFSDALRDDELGFLKKRIFDVQSD
jgi:hypothetical protein